MKRSVVGLYKKVCDIQYARASVETTRARSELVAAESGVEDSHAALGELDSRTRDAIRGGVSSAQLGLLSNERTLRERELEAARARAESQREVVVASDARLARSMRKSKRAQVIGERFEARRHREGVRREQRELDDLGPRYAAKRMR